MTRRRIPLLLGLLAILAALWPLSDDPEARLEAEAETLSSRLKAAEPALGEQAKGLLAALGTRRQQHTDGQCVIPNEFRRQQRTLGITYVVLRAGDTVAWSGNGSFDQAQATGRNAVTGQGGAWLRAEAGNALLGEHVVVLRSLWGSPPFENRFLEGGFHPSWGMPGAIIAAQGSGLGPVVRSPDGAVLCRLAWRDDDPPVSPWRYVQMACLFFGLGIGAWLLWRYAMGVARNGRPGRAMLLVTLSVVLVRWAGLLGARTLPTSELPWSGPTLFASAAWLPSFFDLLISVAIVLYLSAFIHSVVQQARPPRGATSAAFIAAVALWGQAGLIHLLLVAVVRDSRLALDLFHPQDLDGASITALCALAATLLSWVLLADAALRWLLPALHRGRGLVIMLGVAVLAHVVHHLFGQYDSLVVLWPVPALLALVWIRDAKRRTVAGVMLLATLSLFTVHVLDRQTMKRIERDRAALAESTGTREDPIVEWLFQEARRAILVDPEARTLLRSDPVAGPDANAWLRQRFFGGAWENYDVRLHVFPPMDAPGSGMADARGSLMGRFEQGVPVEGDPHLRNVHRTIERALYIGLIGGAGEGLLVVELLPRVLPEGPGFPELLMAGDRAVERRAGRFAWARYEHGVLVESSGPFAFDTRLDTTMLPSGVPVRKAGHELLATSVSPHTNIVVYTPTPDTWRRITTFSYMFVFFAMLAAAAFVVRAFLMGGPRPVKGVSGKLRIGILAVTVLGTLLFAAGSQWLLSAEIAARITSQLDDRSRSAVAELRQHVRAETAIDNTMRSDLDHWLDKAAQVLLTDITAYGPDGTLLATSREQLFNYGLLGRRMDPDAYVAMANEHRSLFMHEERIGKARFSAAYRPLLNDRGDVLAYLAVPYFARQSEVDDARAAGYVAMVNLFVLLFLIGVGAATLIATWTTRPLSALKRGLERIQLGARNEPLPYQGEDELGELVRVYNRKVEELRDSAEKLARSERESAWKEMARQVAHEIKNPLTPMKLGIQHFQQTWDPKAADAKERLDRFTTSMVEQIDALSRVAGDFSRFAQMSAAKEEELDLNDVADNAVALFAGEPNADITLHPSPDWPLRVKADREHLLRVLNNLIKNATQAIPEDRRGRIDVLLRTEGDRAIVEVRDNGTGIPEYVRDRIFEPSFTTKSSGMGLGLAMVKRMLEQAGGTVRFTTQPGEGTTFVVTIPLLK